MFVKVPQLSADKAALQSVAIGQLGIGPISVGNLVLNNVDFAMSAAQGVLQNMTVTVTLHITMGDDTKVNLDCVICYKRSPDDKIASLRAFWETAKVPGF